MQDERVVGNYFFLQDGKIVGHYLGYWPTPADDAQQIRDELYPDAIVVVVLGDEDDGRIAQLVQSVGL